MSLGRRLCSAFLALLLLASQRPAHAAEDATPSPEGDEVFGIESPLGRIDYRAGRGLHVGRTGLTIGGFATADAERLEGGESRGGIDHVNFLVFYDPFSFLHLFTEIEVNDILDWETGKRGARSDPGTKVERLYADLGWTDAANLRVGKFLTPFGRWNQVLAEPLLWTTSEPLIVEEVFDETQSGAMLWGTFFPRGTALSWAFYGTFLDHIAPDRDAPPAQYSLGGRLEWTSRGGASIGASYVAAARSRAEWNHLGGLDALWRPHERVELSSELLFGEGSHEEGGQWGLYAQAVVETVPTLYLIGRYDRYDLPASARGIDLFTIGATWVPRYYLRLKVDYRFADHRDDLSEPGLRASFSVLF
jgi:hypothetical protein